jgi:hypothetical protein
LGKHWVHQTYIDLSNVCEDDQSPARGLSGTDNYQNDLEITFTCATPLSTNCNMYVMMHYVSVQQLDAKSGLVKVF